MKAGKVYGTATEDMDALTFGSNVLLRHMTFSEARKMPIKEFHLDNVLQEAGLTQQEVGGAGGQDRGAGGQVGGAGGQDGGAGGQDWGAGGQDWGGGQQDVGGVVGSG